MSRARKTDAQASGSTTGGRATQPSESGPPTDDRPLLIFDVYGTLLAHDGEVADDRIWSFMAQWLALRDLRVGTGPAAWDLYEQSLARVAETYGTAVVDDLDPVTVWELVMAEAGAPEALTPVLAAEAALTFRQVMTRTVGPMPGARETLDALAPEWRLAIAGNGNRLWTAQEMRSVDMLDWFETVSLTSDVGVRKPAPNYIEAVLERTGVERHRAIYVGDNPGMDIAAASAAGVGCVLLNRSLMNASSARVFGKCVFVEDGDITKLPALASKLLETQRPKRRRKTPAVEPVVPGGVTGHGSAEWLREARIAVS